MSRLKGKTIVFSVDGTDYSGSVKNVKFTSAVGELGFGNYEDNLEFTCEITGFQDLADAGLHKKLWDNAGATIDLVFAPHGNGSPSSSQPLFEASGYAETIPDVGGAAGEYFVYDLNIILDGKPTRRTS